MTLTSSCQSLPVFLPAIAAYKEDSTCKFKKDLHHGQLSRQIADYCRSVSTNDSSACSCKPLVAFSRLDRIQLTRLSGCTFFMSHVRRSLFSQCPAPGIAHVLIGVGFASNRHLPCVDQALVDLGYSFYTSLNGYEKCMCVDVCRCIRLIVDYLSV